MAPANPYARFSGHHNAITDWTPNHTPHKPMIASRTMPIASPTSGRRVLTFERLTAGTAEGSVEQGVLKTLSATWINVAVSFGGAPYTEVLRNHVRCAKISPVAGEDADSRVFRRVLIEKLRLDGHLRSYRVAEAMAAVPRELFVPGVPLDEAYRPSDAIVTKRLDGISVSSASAPEVVAIMLEQLDVRPGMRVLEIGAGTGYNAALLAHLVGPSGHVVTVDIDEDLVLSARDHLDEAGYSQVNVIQSDGALGYPTSAPFDRIILTVASSDIAPAWREQLGRPGGRLVLPLALAGPQRCAAFTQADDHLVSDSIRNCSFIPLRGVLASASLRVPLESDGGTVLTGGDVPLPLSADEIAGLLRAPARKLPTGVVTGIEEVREGLHLWLVTHLPDVYMLWGGQRVPDLFGLPDRTAARATLCVMDSETLVLLAWSDEADREGELSVLTPVGGEELAQRVQRLLIDWNREGRPRDVDLLIRAFPRGVGPDLDSGQVAVDQRWSRFVLEWGRSQPPEIFTV
jgi:protein-L-isoaspartate(D-aspartate) O-methyltransferase